MLLKSLISSQIITHSLKYSVNKKRPNGRGSRSFPSGHTSVAFTAAGFMHKRYGFSYGLPAYLAASFVGYSRVESKNHYPDDVYAGALIGIVSAFYFTEPNPNYRLLPKIDDTGSVGIELEIPW